MYNEIEFVLKDAQWCGLLTLARLFECAMSEPQIKQMNRMTQIFLITQQ